MAEKDEVVNILNQIGQTLGIQKYTDPVVPEVSSILKSATGNKISTVISQIRRIGTGVIDLVKSDNNSKLTGLMTVVSAVFELFPILSAVKGFALFALSLFLGSLSGKENSSQKSPKSVEEVMKIIIADAFSTHTDALVKSEADSVCRVLTFAHNILIGFQSKCDGEITEHDVINLVTLIDINAGVKALGKIESQILTLIQSIPELQTDPEISKRCMRVNQYVDMYCRLATLRDAVMLELYAVITYSGYGCNLANGIIKGMEGEQERDKILLQCLVFPEQDQVHIAAFFDPERWPVTYEFMKNRKIFDLIENLENVPIAMNTMKWMNWFVSHRNKSSGYLHSSGCSFVKHVRNKKHNFVVKKKDNDTCYYISPQGNSNVYMVMGDDANRWVKLKTGKPGKEGEWNIFNIKNMDAIYMLSTRRWPAYFLCMSDTWWGWLHGRSTTASDPKNQWILHYNGRRA